MPVIMVHTITEPEFSTGYINLKDDTYKKQDTKFPPPKAKIAVGNLEI